MSASLNIPKIRVRIASVSQKSGYGMASRNISKSFLKSDIPAYFDSNDVFFDKMPKTNEGIKINFYIRPPFMVYEKEDGDYNIGYFYWETDTLPREWSVFIKKRLDEIWVPCEITANACRKAGFQGPIEIVHTPLDFDSDSLGDLDNENQQKQSIESVYIFYSIFQWHHRKGYDKLFQAYYEEFDSSEDVLLFVKTSPVRHKEHGIHKIEKDLEDMSELYAKDNMPKVYVIKNPVPESSINEIHNIGDCFVLPHRGEGWGMPIHEAISEGNLVITTKFGGITEKLNDSNSMIIGSERSTVTPMNWNGWYQDYQEWAEPSVTHLRELMRQAYNEGKNGYPTKRSEAKKLGRSMNIESFAESAKKILLKERFKNMV
jgi:glycosyltransferase involved in cell wall biosynthesis